MQLSSSDNPPLAAPRHGTELPKTARTSHDCLYTRYDGDDLALDALIWALAEGWVVGSRAPSNCGFAGWLLA